MLKPLQPQINWNNPLTKSLRLCCPMFERGNTSVNDITPNKIAGLLSGGTWKQGFFGPRVNFANTTDNIDLGNLTSILPTSTITIILSFRKTDSTNRNSGLFGFNVDIDQTTRCGTHCPFSDGTVYFDFGGAANGTTRVQAAGLSFSANDIWVFSVGARGMELWQNGILRASNSATPTRTATTNDFFLGKHAGNPSDLVDWNFFYMYGRQLQASEIKQLSTNPQQIFKMPLLPRLNTGIFR